MAEIDNLVPGKLYQITTGIIINNKIEQDSALVFYTFIHINSKIPFHYRTIFELQLNPPVYIIFLSEIADDYNIKWRKILLQDKVVMIGTKRVLKEVILDDQ